MAGHGGRTALLSELGLHSRDGRDVPVSGLSVDSRETKPGHLFAALPGTNSHGAEFITYAARMGAVAVLTDRKGAKIAAEVLESTNLVVVIAEDPRQALAFTAAIWFGRQPEHMVAITGTNGKTSVATFLRQIWTELGLQAANIGTTGVEGAVDIPLKHTTPEPITLHRVLAELAGQGVDHAAMEASSHGLAQRRLDGVRLEAAGFTNFSQDHLDYHANFDEYFAAKAGLFDRVLSDDGVCVIYDGDARSPEVEAIAKARDLDLIKVGRSASADLRITAQRFDATGQDVRFDWFGDIYQARLELIGGFQAENILLAAGLAIAVGATPAAVFATLERLKPVRGRMELAAMRENGASVFVDYSHTPDSVETALKALRPHVMGRLVIVLGAGGDRDKGKRILMGQAAAAHADVVFVTDDNPRTEDPATIRQAVMEGCPDANEVGDRAEAILRAVDTLAPGDALLIAGKGHETGQIIGTQSYPFDDVEQASVAVAALDGHIA